MNFWILSPNVTANYEEEPQWKELILSKHLAFIGWGKGDPLGDAFVDKIKVGDIVLIAQGANWQKRLFLCGIVSSDARNEYIDGAPKATLFRELRNTIDKQTLESLELDFNGGAYGDSNQIPALYQLKPWQNPIDKIVSEKLLTKIKSAMASEELQKKIAILKHKNQIILQGPPGTGKTYTAKDVAEQMIFGSVSSEKNQQKEKLEKAEQFKLVQFHPSYSYEDFVRGITAKTNGQNVEYKTENRILAEFAKIAFDNCFSLIYNERQWPDVIGKFKKYIQGEIAAGRVISLTPPVRITSIDDEKVLYYGHDNDKSTPITFDELKAMWQRNPDNNSDLTNLEGISGTGRSRPSYHLLFYKKFREFLSSSTMQRPFVLIVDEINRANLPAVLGELIYALEYRGESVESMYSIDGDRKIVLPPNLYIIGTMNTADRSVGHIDYAIRRRFAFVDVSPSDVVIDEVVPATNDLKGKAKRLFNKVAEFFSPEKLAADFKKNEVQLGHSYFLADTEEKLKLKLEYEIKPLLKEYLKDGILMSVRNADGKDQTEIDIESLTIV